MEQRRRKYEHILLTEGEEAAWRYAQGEGMRHCYPQWY